MLFIFALFLPLAISEFSNVRLQPIHSFGEKLELQCKWKAFMILR